MARRSKIEGERRRSTCGYAGRALRTYRCALGEVFGVEGGRRRRVYREGEERVEGLEDPYILSFVGFPVYSEGHAEFLSVCCVWTETKYLSREVFPLISDGSGPLANSKM